MWDFVYFVTQIKSPYVTVQHIVQAKLHKIFHLYIHLSSLHPSTHMNVLYVEYNSVMNNYLFHFDMEYDAY